MMHELITVTSNITDESIIDSIVASRCRAVYLVTKRPCSQITAIRAEIADCLLLFRQPDPDLVAEVAIGQCTYRAILDNIS